MIFVEYEKAKFQEGSYIKEFKIESRNLENMPVGDSVLFDLFKFVGQKLGITEEITNNPLEWKLKDCVYRILEVEAPVLPNVCVERICQEFKIHLNRYQMDYLNRVIQNEIDNNRIINKNNFLYLQETKLRVRNRYNAFAKVELDKIPMQEYYLAAYSIIKEEFGIEEKELVRIIAKSLGVNRVSQHVQNSIAYRIRGIQNDKDVVFKDNRYYYSKDSRDIFLTSTKPQEGLCIGYKPLEKIEYQVSLRKNAYFTTQEKRLIMQSDQLKEYIYKVLLIEAPIHIEDCFSRIIRHLSIKSSKDYLSYYKRYLNEEIAKGKIIKCDNFLYLPNTQTKIRNRNNSLYELYCGKIEVWKIPPEEIYQIALNIIENSGTINEDNLVKFVAKEIGFGRVTQNIYKGLKEVIEPIKNNVKLRYENGQFTYLH